MPLKMIFQPKLRKISLVNVEQRYGGPAATVGGWGKVLPNFGPKNSLGRPQTRLPGVQQQFSSALAAAAVCCRWNGVAVVGAGGVAGRGPVLDPGLLQNWPSLRSGGCRWPTLPNPSFLQTPQPPPVCHQQRVLKIKQHSSKERGWVKEGGVTERCVGLWSKWWRLRLCSSRVKATARSGYISVGSRPPRIGHPPPPESKLRAVTEWQISRAVAESRPDPEVEEY